MSEWMPQGITDLANVFDQDFGNNELQDPNRQDLTPVAEFPSQTSSNSEVFNYQDPLKYVHKYQFQPLALDLGNTHTVDPHYVDGYFRKDGTYVEPYYRDGDGNPATHLSKEQGGGYLRSNPDSNPFNNLD